MGNIEEEMAIRFYPNGNRTAHMNVERSNQTQLRNLNALTEKEKIKKKKLNK